MTTHIDLNSEIGALRNVVVHTPGQELENMTPDTAEDVLYDDILNLPLAEKEHAQLKAVLQQVCTVHEFRDLLAAVLENAHVQRMVVEAMCKLFDCPEVEEELLEKDATSLARQLIEGTRKVPDSLRKFLDPSPYVIPPLPNTFFTRDATICVNHQVVIGSMAYRARVAEALLLKAIFKYHPDIKSDGFYFDGTESPESEISIEGGDLLVIREDLVVIGYSERTSVTAIDMLMRDIASKGPVTDFIVVEIPKARATIHLDMVFTMVDTDACVIYPPLITGKDRCRAYHCHFGNNPRAKITEYKGVLQALESQGISLRPIACGGDDPFTQEREQWAAGANYFAFGPGRIIGYKHNIHTLQALSDANFAVVDASAMLAGKTALPEEGRVVVSIDGAELSRGGGGCRCMTMPLAREAVSS